MLSLRLTPEYRAIGTDSRASFFERACVQCDDGLAQTEITPLDIVCILDTSGSMYGEKIDCLKNAMHFIVDSLKPVDRLSIVFFNTIAGVVLDLLEMSVENKEIAHQNIEELEADCDTNIFAGMKLGYSIIADGNGLSSKSIFLLTDGQDPDNIQEKLELSRTFLEQNISLFVFGFGCDHDSAHMTLIARESRGLFTYVENADNVVDAFGGALGSLKGMTLREVTVVGQVNSVGLTIEEAMCGSYKSVIAPDKKSVTVWFHSLFAGESRDVLLRLSLPALGAPQECYPLLTATASCTVSRQVCFNHNTSSIAEAEQSHCDSTASTDFTTEFQPLAPPRQTETQQCVCDSVIARLDKTDCQPVQQQQLPDSQLQQQEQRDVSVDAQLNRYLVTQALTQALQAADQSDLTTAMRILHEVEAPLLNSVSHKQGDGVTAALVHDLTAARKVLQSEGLYVAGGRAVISSAACSHDTQRCVFSLSSERALYQTASSEAQQAQAITFKMPGKLAGERLKMQSNLSTPQHGKHTKEAAELAALAAKNVTSIAESFASPSSSSSIMTSPHAKDAVELAALAAKNVTSIAESFSESSSSSSSSSSLSQGRNSKDAVAVAALAVENVASKVRRLSIMRVTEDNSPNTKDASAMINATMSLKDRKKLFEKNKE